VVFECALNQLVEEIGWQEFVNIHARKVMYKDCNKNWVKFRTAKVKHLPTTTSLQILNSLQMMSGWKHLIRKSVFSWEQRWVVGSSRFSGLAVHLPLGNFDIFTMRRIWLTLGTNFGQSQRATLARSNQQCMVPIHK
jgi:hypothetical protein